MVNRAYCIDIYQGDNVVGDHDEGFASVKALGIAFLDHKASQGVDKTDRMAAFRLPKWLEGPPIVVIDVDGSSLQLAPRAGLYHFNGTASAKAEASHFITVVKPLWKPGIDLTLDWEDIGASGYQRPASWADDFCKYVEDTFGFAVKVYGGDAPREQLAIASTAIVENFRKRRLWFCQYGQFAPSLVPSPWKQSGSVFQWQDDGDSFGPGRHVIPGISGYCDNSTVVGTMTVAKMNAEWGGGLGATA